jgi:hypothetical protein
VFDDFLVFQSNLLGVHPDGYKNLQAHATIIHQIEIKLEEATEEAVYKTLIDSETGRRYDFKAILYFAWRGFLWHYFKKPLPKRNLWGDKQSLLCTEMAEKLPHWLIPINADENLDMVSPHQLYALLKERMTTQG